MNAHAQVLSPALSKDNPTALAQAFCELLSGNARNHGVTTNNRSKERTRKVEVDSSTSKGPPSPSLWQAHLNGAKGLGIVPIRDDGTCLWSVIDVDKYDIDFNALAQTIEDQKLPLVICRSKSGGAHIYAFFKDPVLASDARALMTRMETLLRLGRNEVFPKQDKLEVYDGERENGNWLNMPYFKAEMTTRHAVGIDGALTAEEFIEAAKKIKLSTDEVQDWLARDIARPEREPKVSRKSDEYVEETSVEDGAAYAAAMLQKYAQKVEAAIEGQRNEVFNKAVFHLATMAARDWLTEQQIKESLLAAAEACGLMSGDERSKTLNTLKGALKRGLRRPHPNLEMSPDNNNWLARMNAEFSVVDIQGKAYVVLFKDDALGRSNPTYYTFESFKHLHDHVRVGKLGLGSWWLSQRGRRQYAGITYRPGKKGAVVDVPGDLNLWRGFGLEPQPGDWSLMKRHILEVLASKNEDHFKYIVRWLAWAVQNPGDRAETVLVFKSEEEGSGKGTLGNTMHRIFGSHGRRVDRAEHLTGKFNAHLQDVSLLFADEAFWPGDKSAEGALKGLITEPTRMVEPKGVNAYEVPNCLHVIMASNNTWTVPAGASARRFAVFRVSPHRVGDSAWFKALHAQLDQGGREAMLHDLLAMELEDWHPRDDVPKTEELLLEKINTLSPEHKWWFGILDRGQLPTYPPLSASECVTQYLYEDYVSHSGKTGARHRSIEVQIGKFLKDLMPCLRKQTRAYREKGKDARGQVYSFPTLSECRKAFERLLQQKWEWDGPSDWLDREEHEGSSDDIPF